MSEHTVELGAGSGVVAVVGGAVLFVTDGDAAERLVEAVRDAVAADAPVGRPLAHRLAGLLTGDEADTVPAFGALAETEDGWVVLLHGAVTATIATADGTEEDLSGASSVIWADRIVPPTTRAVLIAPVDLARPGASPLRLEAGVVPGGWVRVATSRPTATALGTDAEPALAEFELFSLSPDGVDARPPLPVEGVEFVAPAATAPELATTSEPVESATGDPCTSLGLLVFDDGSVYGLDDNYVLGREPEIDEAVVAGSARPIALEDPADTVSRVHAEIRLVAADVQLIDRGSTNGTHLWDELNGAWDRLVPGTPRVMRPGERGAIGQRIFVYEVPTAPPGDAPAARPVPETVGVAPRLGTLTGGDGAVYPLDRSYVIGRDPLSDDESRRSLASPIVIRDDQVSRVHAYVTVAAGAVSVRDAGTPGGTFIAAPAATTWERLGSDSAELPPGWSVRVGPYVFTFRAGS